MVLAGLLLCWLLLMLLGLLLGGVMLGLLILVLMPVLAYLYAGLRYRRRVMRMIQQLPQLLDHVIRSLKSGRTLGDAMLLAMENAQSPLHDALTRTRNSVGMGVPLAEAIDDFARIYEREEFHILALGVQVNQQYGGNASELLENLIVMIRDRERASRQLRAMTGETRISAMGLAGMPVALAIYILSSNPAFLMGLWESSDGRMLLLCALALQGLGCFFMWRMLRSI
jgi:tight adherence protein B